MMEMHHLALQHSTRTVSHFLLKVRMMKLKMELLDGMDCRPLGLQTGFTYMLEHVRLAIEARKAKAAARAAEAALPPDSATEVP